MRGKKGFTLIELLAIIVILAIIAVITVPIILNIIENARKGTATDSAYGYRDAVDKWFVSELFDSKNLKLDGDYIVEDGKLKGSGISDSGVVIPADGTIPTSGTLTYENSVFKSGCLVIGDYAVTFNSDGSTSTDLGECQLVIPTISNCPGCKFIYTTNLLTIGEDVIPVGATDDYRTLNVHPYFLGLIANPNTNVVERAFACGIEGSTPFCLEGTDGPEGYIVATNILNMVFPGCNAGEYGYSFCNGTTVRADANEIGGVSVIDYYIDNDCRVRDGVARCFELPG